MSDSVVILVSSLSSSSLQEVAQRRMESFLEAERVVFEKVDGSVPENKPIRDVLFASSGQRGKYPQLFVKKSDNSYTFIGLWEQVESMIERDEFREIFSTVQRNE